MDPYNEIERLLQEKREEAEKMKIRSFIFYLIEDQYNYQKSMLRLYDLIVVIASLKLALKSLN